VKGGFYSHPTNEDLFAGTPRMKKPLECVLSVCSNSENAIVSSDSPGAFLARSDFQR
jgi:hypothetical protein